MEPEAKPVLDALRKATNQGSPTLEPTIYRYALNEEISYEGITALLQEFDVAWSTENLRHATLFIVEHNKLVRAMRSDKKGDVDRLVTTFKNVEKIGEEWDFILP